MATESCTQWNIIHISQKKKKERNSVICNNMDEPGGHYAKWCETDRERQIPHGITNMRNLKKKSLNHKNRVKKSFPGSMWWGKWGDIGKGVQTFCSTMNNSVTRWMNSNILHGNYSFNTLLYNWNFLRIEPKCLHHK